MGKYSDDPAWADIAPLPTDEGGPNPLAAIAYSEEYGETMSYLRAIMAKVELSARALALTEHLIDMNPAHYTVWLYRAQCLFALGGDSLNNERAWLNEIALANQKNYQIWHHRNLIVDHLNNCDGEREFVAKMFALDAKNYHVWAYRQWLVKRFGLWDDGELEFTEDLLKKDVKNNSAWNHRWYIINGRGDEGVAGVRDKHIREREIGFVKRALEKSPNNTSPWRYLLGIARKSGIQLSELKEVAMRYADLSKTNGVQSSHALDLLHNILAEEEGGEQEAVRALDLLTTTYDPIRKNYWEYRKGGITNKDATATV